MDLNDYTKEELIAYVRTIETEPELVVQQKLEEYSSKRFKEGYESGYKSGFERSAAERVSKILDNAKSAIIEYLVEDISREVSNELRPDKIMLDDYLHKNLDITTISNPMDFTTTAVIHIRSFTFRVTIDDAMV